MHRNFRGKIRHSIDEEDQETFSTSDYGFAQQKIITEKVKLFMGKNNLRKQLPISSQI